MSHSQFAAFTIVAHNYLPRARVLGESFRRVHPDAAFFIVVIDHPLKVRLRQEAEPELVPIVDIDFGAEGFQHMAVAYNVTEFATAIKPFALRHFLADFECVLYIDPDVEIYAPLDPIVEATVEHGISLTPHCLQPIARDGAEPSEIGIMAAGIFNLGYIGVARQGSAFVEWWAERLRRDSIVDPANHLFTDQRWIDISVPIFRPYIEASPAYNVAYWNLDQRPIERRDGAYFVGDEPLRFFHFSGYEPDKPHWISRHQPSTPRVRLSDHPVLAQLFDEYGARVLAVAGTEDSNLEYGWAQAFPGLELTAPIRRAFRDDLLLADAGQGEMPPSPFNPGGTEPFLQWLSSSPPHAGTAIPRYLTDIWTTRPDVRIRMPGAASGDLRRIRTWAVGLGGADEQNIALLGWRPEAEQRFDLVHTIADVTRHGVNLVGYLQAELGVGEAARLTESALRRAGVGVATVSLHRTVSRQEHPHPVDSQQRYDTVLMAVNADQFRQTTEDLGRPFFEGRYTIGQWFWELDEFPDEFRAAFDCVDEVWAASRFVRDAIAQQTPAHVVVTHQPLPFATPIVDHRVTRADFGLDDGFMFLFCFDMMSVLERKNPLGLVEAYRSAFSAGDGTRLVLKTMNGARNAEGLELLRWAARGRSDIVVIDEVFTQARTANLMNATDCYTSLHRSEGLGLTMAEALLLGKPVIATGYSGNMDFMSDATAHLVRWTPGTVTQRGGPYRQGARWAEPDLQHAATLMRSVANDPEASKKMCERAQRQLLDQYSPERCGQAMLHRLEDIWSRPT